MAGGVPAGTLSIEIVAEVARLQQDMRQVQRDVAQMAGGVQRDAGRAGQAFVGMGTGAAKASIGANQLAGEMRQLKAQLDPAWAAQERFNHAQDLAVAAMKAGVITRDQLITRMRQVNAELKSSMAAANGAAGASSQQRAGLQQLGYQLGDFSTQVSSGTSITQAFAQQIGQTSQALQLMGGGTGALGKVAAFLGSGWGIAFSVALPVLAVFVSKLFESEDAATKADKAHRSFAEVLGDTKSSYQDVTEAIRAYNKEQDKSRQLTLDELTVNAAVITSNIRKAITTRQNITATLEATLATGRLLALQGQPDPLNPTAAPQALLSAREEKARADLLENAKALRDLGAGARNAVASIADELARLDTDASHAIEDRFRRERNIATATIHDVRALAAEYARIDRAKQAALDAEKSSGRSERTSAQRGLTAMFGSPVTGGTIGGRFGEARPGHAHGGVDIRVPVGTAVRAVADGIISFAGARGDYGNLVELDTGGAVTRDAHLSKILVAEGQRIARGELIGLSGGARGAIGAGNSTGPHVHHEVRVGNRPVNPIGRYAIDPGAVEDAAAEARQKAQEATDKLVKSDLEYIATLKRETEEIGKTAQQLRWLEVERRAAAAATPELRDQILRAAALREVGLAAVGVGEAINGIGRALEAAGGGIAAFFGDVAQAAVEKTRQQAEALERQLRELQDLVNQLDRLGGKTGKALGAAGALLVGLQGGDFSGVGGAAGSLLQLLNGNAGGKQLITTFVGELDKIFGGKGTFAATLKGVLEGAGIGVAAGNVVLGGKSSGLGASVGGAIGEIAGKAIGKKIGGLLGEAAGPLGAIAGGILGGALGGLLKKTRKGTATLGFGADGLGIASIGGNSASRQQAASGLGRGVIGGLQQIADQLGADLGGPISVSIGVRDKSIRVDPTGAGNTRTKNGAIDFGQDEAAAVKFAIGDAIRDGAITGLRAGTTALLNAGDDVEKQLGRALKFQGVFDDLKQRADPLGFALDQLGREFTELRTIFGQAGASAEEYAQLEQLLALRRDEAIADAESKAVEQLRDRRNLEIRVLELLGRETDAVAAGRELEVAGLKASLRPLQSLVYQLEDARKVIDTFGPLAEDLRSYRAEVLGGNAAQGGFAFLRGQFRSTAGLAAQGDAEALGQLRGTASAFLDAARENAASGLDYQRAVGEVLAGVDRGLFAADSQVEYAQLQIDAIAANTDILTSIRDQLDRQQQAIADNTAKLVTMWQRYDGDGLTVKTDSDTPLAVEVLP